MQRPSRPEALASFIDHTLLKADATEQDIVRLCEEALKYNFRAVCVNPIFVEKTRELLKGSEVWTASVIGFPLGASHSVVKCLETEIALENGAAEIDMVIRLDLVKANRWLEVEEDILDVTESAGDCGVKVILETGLLTAGEIVQACRVSENAGAAFVKTATGFLGRGATVEDILLMKKSCGLQIKASGGIKTYEQAMAMIDAGANRLGTSSGVALVTGGVAGAGY